MPMGGFTDAPSKQTIVINLFGGPGVGKSTIAAHLFYHMKMLGYNVELVTEYAKDLTWRESHKVLNTDALYVFAKQNNRMRMCSDKVDFIITDSPILLSMIYDPEHSPQLRDMILYEYNRYKNYNIIIDRIKPYSKIGRSQTLDEAIEIDNKIVRLLANLSLPYTHISDLNTAVKDIFDAIEELHR
jgi:tRNA uridine 5-carbamoylmethylation protein Kti12